MSAPITAQLTAGRFTLLESGKLHKDELHVTRGVDFATQVSRASFIYVRPAPRAEDDGRVPKILSRR